MSAPATPARSRNALSFRAFGIVMLVVGVAIVAVAALLYSRFLRYEHVAYRHVPAKAVAAVRIDVTQAALYDPVRRYVLPLLGGVHVPAAEGDARLAAFEKQSGLHRGDLREIVAGRGASQDDWVVALNGVFPRDAGGAGFVAALSREAGWVADPDGRAATNSATGYVAARADDGVLLLASSRPWLDAARTSGERGGELGIDPNGVGGFGLGREALDRIATTPSVLGARDLPRLLQETRGVRGVFVLGEERVAVEVTFDADPDVAHRTASGTKELLEAYARQDPSPLGPLVRLGLERGAAAPAPPDGGHLVFVWERIELDRGLSFVTEAVRR